MNTIGGAVLLCFGLVWLLGAEALGAEELLRTQRSWDGGAVAYPDGVPEITSIILRLEEGSDTAFHCHPVPTMGFVLTGTVAVETAEGRVQQFEAGDSVLEVMNTPHRGRAVGGRVEIVVFYAGAAGVANTLLAEPGSGSCTE